MNKLLVVIFDNEPAADAGLKALRTLHTAGDITLYAAGVMAKDAAGQVAVRKSMAPGPVGAVTGLAVGGLIGLLAGPLGMVAGAATGSLVGAVRDYWVAGVGLDFVEQVGRELQPGKVALVADVEEEWVTPVDVALEAVGGRVWRRNRGDVADARLDHDVAAFEAEIADLESEAAQASGEVRTTLEAKLAAARAGLDGAVHRAGQRVDQLKQEAEAKADALEAQLVESKGAVKTRIEDRMKRVKSGYHARGAKLSQAWSLAKEAIAG